MFIQTHGDGLLRAAGLGRWELVRLCGNIEITFVFGKCNTIDVVFQ